MACILMRKNGGLERIGAWNKRSAPRFHGINMHGLVVVLSVRTADGGAYGPPFVCSNCFFP
jgi:hypothetical protein